MGDADAQSAGASHAGSVSKTSNHARTNSLVSNCAGKRSTPNHNAGHTGTHSDQQASVGGSPCSTSPDLPAEICQMWGGTPPSDAESLAMLREMVENRRVLDSILSSIDASQVRPDRCKPRQEQLSKVFPVGRLARRLWLCDLCFLAVLRSTKNISTRSVGAIATLQLILE